MPLLVQLMSQNISSPRSGKVELKFSGASQQIYSNPRSGKVELKYTGTSHQILLRPQSPCGQSRVDIVDNSRWS